MVDRCWTCRFTCNQFLGRLNDLYDSVPHLGWYAYITNTKLFHFLKPSSACQFHHIPPITVALAVFYHHIYQLERHTAARGPNPPRDNADDVPLTRLLQLISSLNKSDKSSSCRLPRKASLLMRLLGSYRKCWSDWNFFRQEVRVSIVH